MNNSTELRLKPNAANQTSLPLTNNISGDIRKTIDTGLLFCWRKNQSTGLLSDWEQITNLLESGHDQNTDQYLDFGGVNQIQVTEIDKKLIENKEYWIDCVLGDDINDGSQLTPFKTIQHAINLIPNNLGGFAVDIFLKPSLLYTETVVISNLYNGSYLSISSSNNNTVGVLLSGVAPITTTNCSIPIYLNYFSTKVTSDGAYCFYFENSNIYITNCAVSDNVNINTSGAVVTGGTLYLYGLTNYDANKVATGMYVGDSGIIFDAGFNTAGDILKKVVNGGMITDAIILSRADYDDAIDKKHRSIVNEVPTGLINGINTDFSLTYTPILGTVQVFLCGLLQSSGSGNDYVISGTTISFMVAPETNMLLRVVYDI